MPYTTLTTTATLLLLASLALCESGPREPLQAKTAATGTIPRGGPPRVLAEHNSPVLALAWSPDGRQLASGAQDGTVRLTDPGTGKEVRGFSTGGAVTALAFSPDGKTLAVCQSDVGKVSAWEASTGRQVRDFGNAGNGTVEDVAITPDNQSLEGVAVGRIWTWQLNGGGGGSMMSNAAGGCAGIALDGAACGWCDARGFVQIRLHQPGGKNWMGTSTSLQVGKSRCLAFAPGGKRLAVGDDKGVHLWDIATRKKTTALAGLEAPAARLAFSGDGQSLAALEGDGTRILVWDLSRNAPRCRMHHTGAIRALALSPDGKTLATAAKGDKAIFLAKTAPRELSVRATPLALSMEELAALWDDLANPDAAKADAAWHKLGSAGDNAVPFLRQKIRRIAVPAVDLTKIDQWVADLGSEKYATRERATRELLAAGELAVVPLQRLLAKKPSAEAVKRADFVLPKISAPVRTPERQRVLEAVALLERVATTPAVALLQEIARDSLLASIRLEARMALRRIAPSPDSRP